MVSSNDIAAQLRVAITAGEYKPGDKLPSYREIAREFGSVENTAGAAVHQLASEGLVMMKNRSPAVVRARDADSRSPELRLTEAREELRAVHEEIRDARHRLGDLEQRVLGALSKIDG